MGYQPLEELLPKANGSVYKLVRMASRRALEISETGNKLVESPAITKLATAALDEIRCGRVVNSEVAEEFKPKTNGKK
jgi:DNA-directed RNA polymerase omega subunit